jgi:hypothetical protein
MIEDNLQRIADALEAISAKMNVPSNPAPKVKAKKQPVPPAAKTTASVVPTPESAVVVTPTPPVATPTPPAPTAVVMTPEELNAALGVEFGRLGGREPIDKVMAEMGVASITDLQPEQYSVLMEKVRAVVI